MTDAEIAQVLGTADRYEQAQIRKCIYILNTLTSEESAQYNNLETAEEATIFLSTLVEDVEAGTQPMRVYYPPGGSALDPHQEPAETPRQKKENKIKWLRDHPKLVLRLGERGPGDVVTGNTNQNTPKQAEPNPRDQEMSTLIPGHHPFVSLQNFSHLCLVRSSLPSQPRAFMACMISFSNLFISASTICVQFSSLSTSRPVVMAQMVSPSSSRCRAMSFLT